MSAHHLKFEQIRRVYSEAVTKAPGLARWLTAAGVSPADISGPEALSRIPVLKKERFLAMQAEAPPFGGFLGAEPSQLGHIYVSPGPIFEPSLGDDPTGHGMKWMFAEAGIGPSDIALNTWSYHLLPAGLLFDQGLRACAATVIPAGTGNTELVADLLITLRPTAFLGSAAFFRTVVDHLRRSGRNLPADWSLRHAFLAGEFGDWAATRKVIEAEFHLKTWTCYGTGDFGLIGYEVAAEEGYRIHPERYVQICDPDTGLPLPLGEAGEIVVTTLTPGWPLIRFGTGDLGRATELGSDGGVERLAGVEGRVSAARKIREIFVYPDHVRRIANQVAGVQEARLRFGRCGNRDVITIEILPAPNAEVAEEEVGACFRSLTRLRADHVVRVADSSAFTFPDLIAEDRRLSSP
ncbi:MAG: phenylacetate--CoA ligase family protein [Methylobacterium sp.]|nr:phenylacetate--CoA ligase family protein [Rhodobacter sp.]MCA3657057.1 phenylacetate--CoA ligase family protein [Methylobacterium sp.]MCA3672575.1 phenylacetate--CoA ligase family protein [Methylobacterium sp.]MCA3676703.1 phenylacetate--CoA ligase family protein [Methylobacterium sp.]MCA3681139.1 phenylacetate--CoA ligase family protein [Methylobacterium sp.]